MRRFLANDFKSALRLVREAMGEEAVILSHRSVPEGVELVAALGGEHVDPKKNKLNASYFGQTPSPTLPSDKERKSHDLEKDKVSFEATTKKAFSKFLEQTGQEPAGALAENILPPKMQTLEQEVRSMRRMLEAQTAAFSWGRFVDRHREALPLIQEIAKTGLSIAWIERFLSNLDAGAPALPLFAERLASAIRVETNGLPKDGGVIAFFGPTGAGKTSVLMKLVAGLFRENGPGDMALLTMDAAKLGSGEQLRLFGRTLGIPVAIANDEDELQQHLALWRHKKFVFVDTFGIHTKEHLAIQTLARLASNRYLVLPSNLHPKSVKMLERTVADLKPTGVIATKLDEALSLGPLLNFLLDSMLPLAYCTAGPNIPEDIRKLHALELVRLAFAISYEDEDFLLNDNFLFDAP